MKYIFTRSKGINEVIEATMEKPKPNEYNIGEDEMKYYTHDMIEWEQHLSTAPRYPIEGEIHDWEEGDEVAIRLKIQERVLYNGKEKWFMCNDEDFNNAHSDSKRIVAIPIHHIVDTNKKVELKCTCNFTTEFIKGKADCPVHDVDEETEYELWKELIDTFDTEDTKSYGYASLIKELKSRFILTRKTKNNE